jgi:hypothetical protein
MIHTAVATLFGSLAVFLLLLAPVASLVFRTAGEPGPGWLAPGDDA